VQLLQSPLRFPRGILVEFVHKTDRDPLFVPLGAAR